MAKICPECGAYVNEIAKVCYTCGAKLVGETQKSETNVPPSMDNVLPFDMAGSASAESENTSRDFERAINSTHKRDTESGYIPPDFKFDNPAIKQDDDRKAIFFVLISIAIAVVFALVMLFTMESKDDKDKDDIPAYNFSTADINDRESTTTNTTSANADSSDLKLYNQLAKPVQDYYDGLKKGDYDKVMDTYPSSIAKVLRAENKAYGYSEDEYIQQIVDDYITDGIDLKKDDVFISISYAEAYIGDELDELISDYSQYYDVQLKIKEAYYAEASITVFSNGQSNKFTNTCIIVKESGKWYYLD